MAKRHKTTRRENKTLSSLYKKLILVCVISAALLGVYCYFAAGSRDMPVISGPDYPKRTPGKSSSRTKYIVYDQLASAQSSKTAVLLPPEEVPTHLPVWSGDSQQDPVQSGAPRHPVTSGHPSTELVVVPSSDTVEPKTAPVISKKSEIPSAGPQPVAIMKAAKSERSAAAQKDLTTKVPTWIKKGSKLDPKQQKPAPTSTMRMRVGSIYKSANQAHALIQKIAAKGGFPRGMRPVVQKAVMQGSSVYRVILVGQCSMKTLSAYQNWLKKQKL